MVLNSGYSDCSIGRVNQSIIPSTDVIQLALPQKKTTAQAVETSVTVNNSPTKDYIYPDDHAQPANEMIAGFRPFTKSTLIYTW